MSIINYSISDGSMPPFNSQHLKECEERRHLITLATDDTIWDWDLITNLVERSSKAAKFRHLDW